MIKNKRITGSGLAAAVLATFTAGAAIAQDQPAGQGAGGVPFGSMTAYPAVDVSLKHDDNVLAASGGPNKRSSWALVVAPSVKLEGRSQANVYSLAYRGEVGRYESSSADNYTKQEVNGAADMTLSTRARLKLQAQYLESVDPRGSTDRPTLNEPDRWHQWGLNGLFGFGAPGAQGRIELEAGYAEKRYDSNRASAIVGGVLQQGTEFFDQDNSFLGATFFWRVAPKTQLLFQAKENKIDYTFAASTLDSKERRYLAGVTWEATAKTTGIFKLGQLRKDFSDSTRGDFSGSSWEGSIRWSPLTYSTVDFTTGKLTNETTATGTGSGDLVLTKYLNVSWNHNWNPRVSTNLSGGIRDDDFEGSGATRSDDTTTLGLSINYQMRRWLKLGAGYNHTTRSSNNDAFDYNRNVIMFTAGAAL